jgi:hypothetical protein
VGDSAVIRRLGIAACEGSEGWGERVPDDGAAFAVFEHDHDDMRDAGNASWSCADDGGEQPKSNGCYEHARDACCLPRIRHRN